MALKSRYIRCLTEEQCQMTSTSSACSVSIGIQLYLPPNTKTGEWRWFPQKCFKILTEETIYCSQWKTLIAAVARRRTIPAVWYIQQEKELGLKPSQQHWWRKLWPIRSISPEFVWKYSGNVSVKIAVNLVEPRTQCLQILSRIAKYSIAKLGIPSFVG